MTDALALEIDQFLSKQELHELVVRYARGIDRHDADLVKSVFHPGAEMHYNSYRGNAWSFVDMIWSRGGPKQNQHAITNALFEVKGDVGYGECYLEGRWAGVGVEPLACFGRYVDRFERIAGTWRIALRQVTMEWLAQEQGPSDFWPEGYKIANFPPARHDQRDISYERKWD